MTAPKSYKLARRYWRARVAGRPLEAEAQRTGVSASQLCQHGKLWPEILDHIAQSPKRWEREAARALREKL